MSLASVPEAAQTNERMEGQVNLYETFCKNSKTEKNMAEHYNEPYRNR
jgi:hypothetical protein